MSEVLVRGYIRIIDPVDPLAKRRRIVLVDDLGREIYDFRPEEKYAVAIKVDSKRAPVVAEAPTQAPAPEQPQPQPEQQKEG